jgi:anti-anti-sigma factor
VEIKSVQEQGRVPVTVLEIPGRVNLSNAEALEAEARQAYEHGARFMLLDMSATEAITSAGLRAILYIYKLLSTGPEAGGLRLLCPSPEVQRVLRLAGFDRYLGIYSDRQTAIDSF